MVPRQAAILRKDSFGLRALRIFDDGPTDRSLIRLLYVVIHLSDRSRFVYLENVLSEKYCLRRQFCLTEPR